MLIIRIKQLIKPYGSHKIRSKIFGLITSIKRDGADRNGRAVYFKF